jgi:hypothetical protein
MISMFGVPPTTLRQSVAMVGLTEDGYDPTPFQDLRRLVTLVAKGVRRSLFVSGQGGIGKTFIVTETLGDLGLKKDVDWFIFSGKVTTVGLYRTLFMLRHNKLLVFDDADAAFDNPESSTLLKAALDTQTRSLNWLSTRTVNVSGMGTEEKEAFNHRVDDELRAAPDSEKIRFPSEFYFTSRVIFISNRPEASMDQAVLTRVLKISVNLTVPQVFKRIAALVYGGRLGPPELSMYDKIDILNHLIRLFNRGELQNPSLRTFVAASEMRARGVSDWESLLKYS